MATRSKLSFRARNLDANRAMRIYFADELPDLAECSPIARAVAQMPTGMEKEEEMESHAQDALMAQQASTSGIAGSNLLIPTPKVVEVDKDAYDVIYPPQPPPPQTLIKVQAWLSMEREEAEYDVDSEDENWLKDKTHIQPHDLERIFESLEAQSSDVNICQPAAARKALISRYEDAVIDDVYDYWLTKRRAATTARFPGCGGLIPRVRTECRKDSAVLNPYVAFRRRAEKMQTRKNRKNDEDSYEKVLKLGHDLYRARHLFEMIKRREKTKLALLDLDRDILNTRARLGDYGSVVYNDLLQKVPPVKSQEPLSVINGLINQPGGSTESSPQKDDLRTRRKIKKRRSRHNLSGFASSPADRDLPSKAWLKKNAEVWNQSAAAFILGMGHSPAVEVDQSVASAATANPDGRYHFKRRRGAVYRAPILSTETGKLSEVPTTPAVLPPPPRRFYPICLPSTSSASPLTRAESPRFSTNLAAAQKAPPVFTTTSSGGARPDWLKHLMVRRRIGRGGRIIFDRLVDRRAEAQPRVPPAHGYLPGRNAVKKIFDPFELDDIVVDNQKVYKMPLRGRDSEDEEAEGDFISSRFLYSSAYNHSVSYSTSLDTEREAEWLQSARSPSPFRLAAGGDEQMELEREEEAVAAEDAEEEDDKKAIVLLTPSMDNHKGGGGGCNGNGASSMVPDEALECHPAEVNGSGSRQNGSPPLAPQEAGSEEDAVALTNAPPATLRPLSEALHRRAPPAAPRPPETVHESRNRHQVPSPQQALHAQQILLPNANTHSSCSSTLSPPDSSAPSPSVFCAVAGNGEISGAPNGHENNQQQHQRQQLNEGHDAQKWIQMHETIKANIAPERIVGNGKALNEERMDFASVDVIQDGVLPEKAVVEWRASSNSPSESNSSSDWNVGCNGGGVHNKQQQVQAQPQQSMGLMRCGSLSSEDESRQFLAREDRLKEVKEGMGEQSIGRTNGRNGSSGSPVKGLLGTNGTMESSPTKQIVSNALVVSTLPLTSHPLTAPSRNSFKLTPATSTLM